MSWVMEMLQLTQTWYRLFQSLLVFECVRRTMWRTIDSVILDKYWSTLNTVTCKKERKCLRVLEDTMLSALHVSPEN